MVINAEKSKVMLFNTSKKWDFTPHVSLGNSFNTLEVVDSIKLLGIIISSDMKWHRNTNYLCEKAFSRLWILRNLKRLGASIPELVDIYTKQCRAIVELAVPVWTAGLTSDDIGALERVQKTACAIILGRNYRGYEEALKSLNLKSLESRREELCLKFAKKSVKCQKFENWFVEAEKTGKLTRSKRVCNGYKPIRFRTERFRNSPLPFLTSLLNKK